MSHGFLLPPDRPIVPEAVAHEHLLGFLKSFITKSRRARWLSVVAKDSGYWYEKFSQLEDDLDPGCCQRSDGIPEDSTGVCIDFCYQPHWLEGRDCRERYRGMIYSVKAGKLAYYLSADSQLWLCQRS
jgi:hypothetical protein